MDWLFQPLIFSALFAIILGKECQQVEVCSEQYHMAMELAELSEPETSVKFCEILRSYQKCVKSSGQGCRGILTYHSIENSIKTLLSTYCSHKGGSGNSKGSRNDQRGGQSTTTTSVPRPSCKYYGTNKFRHCGFFGDPHLKTFDGKYQTCRVHGPWVLIDNPYMLVQVTNQPVVAQSSATAPTKIVVVVKSSSTPCTLEKRYEADSESPLPSTFVDGTDRPGADETVSLKWRQSSVEDDRETVEITMKYIATKLIIRRVGKYLAFSAVLPEEAVNSSRTDNRAEKVELCTAGCPASEQLDIVAAREYVVSREKALSECRNTENLSDDIKNNLTDDYLDWCVFDVMTAGVVYDFVAVAHSAQADALNVDPSSLRNRTILLESSSNKVNNTSASSRFGPFQLPFYVFSLVCALSRYSL